MILVTGGAGFIGSNLVHGLVARGEDVTVVDDLSDGRKFANIVGASEASIACCVTLGRAASTTEGNGSEVAEWARRYGFTRVIVVTSDYHMDRAMLELQRAMPEGQFTPHAVTSLKVPANRWYTDASTARRLFGEWIKYRIAALRAGDSPSNALAQTAPQ